MKISRLLGGIAFTISFFLFTPGPFAWAYTNGELQFANDARSLGVVAPGIGIDKIIDGGRYVCSELTNMPASAVADELFQINQQPGMQVSVTHAQTEAVVKSAVRNLCPGSWW